MRFRSTLAFGALVAAISAPLAAQTTMGSQPFTFGGTGIDNAHVVTNNNANSVGILLGLEASTRCGIVDCGPTVTNDGVSTFFALSGVSNNPPSPGDPYANWNFDFAIAGANVNSDYYVLQYCFDPTGCAGDMGSLIIAPVPDQDSWNLGMNFLAPPPIVTGIFFPPTGAPFDPNNVGTYTFTLTAYNGQTKVQDAQTSIDVMVCDNEQDRGQCNIPSNPQDTVPEPGTMSLLATGLVGMAGVGLRRRKKH